MLNLTGRQDVNSIRVHLRRYQYNFIAAVVTWQKSGIPVVRPRAHEQSLESGDRFPGLRAHPHGRVPRYPEDAQQELQDNEDWRSESGVSAHTSSEEEAEDEEDVQDEDGSDGDESEDGKELVGTAGAERVGALINGSREPAALGCRDTTKFIIERVKNGRYKALRFRNFNFFWKNWKPKKGETRYSAKNPIPYKERPLFDWNKQSDINVLNTWRRQEFQRITGTQTREAPQDWVEAENDFLYNLHRDRLAELMSLSPQRPRESFLPLRVGPHLRRQWHRVFNDHFLGTVQSGSREPRRERTDGAINTHRGRVDGIVADFKVRHNYPRGQTAGEPAQ